MNKRNIYKIKGEVILYPGETANWYFVYVDKKISEKITKKFGAKKRGWGSLPVLVTLGKTKWKTSIFPDKKEGAYLLPLKSEVRRKESIFQGDKIDFVIEIKP